MPSSDQLSPGAARLVGTLFIASGALPMLAAFDLGPLGRDDIDGPPWIGFAAGMAFAAAGGALVAGPRSPLAARMFGALALAGLATIGNWIAFGAGERICSGSLSLPWVWGDFAWSDLACRIPFGFGAMITDAFLFWALASTLQSALGGPPRLAGLLKTAEWLIIASASPLILLLLVLGLAGAAGAAIKTRIRTGAWPRNEEFIARQKSRGLLGRIGRKRTDGTS